MPKGLGSSQPQGRSRHGWANVRAAAPVLALRGARVGFQPHKGSCGFPGAGIHWIHQRLLPVFGISAAGLGDAQDPSPSHHHHLHWIPTRGWANRQRTLCRLPGQPEIWSERDVNRRQTWTGQWNGLKGYRLPSPRPNCSEEGGSPSPSLPTCASLTRDRQEMKQISVNSLPRVSRRKREGKDLPHDFKRTLKGVFEDSEIFKAKRAPAETQHLCAHGHTNLHA